ncbi:MAG: hypothetical protein AAF989_12380, partial [Planctomycetota bacterium]
VLPSAHPRLTNIMRQFDEDRPTSHAGSWIGKAVLAALVMPFVIVAIGIVWWFTRLASSELEVDERIVLLESEGMPVSDASMQLHYNTKTNSDATLAWSRLLDVARDPKFASTLDTLVSTAMSPTPPWWNRPWEDQAEVERFLSENASLLEEIRRLHESPGQIRFKIRFDGVQTSLEDAFQMKNVSRLLFLEHLVATRNLDSDSATDAVLGILAAARTLDRHPVLLPQLLRLNILSQAAEMIRMGLDANVYSNEQLRQISIALQNRGTATEQLRQALIGERALSLATFRDLQSRATKWHPSISSRSILHSLNLYDKALRTINDDAATTLTELQSLQQEEAAALAGAGWLSRTERMMSGSIHAVLKSLVESFRRTEENCFLAESAIRIRRYHFEHDAWPHHPTSPASDSSTASFRFEIFDDQTAHLWRKENSPADRAETVAPKNDEDEFVKSSWFFRIQLSPRSTEKPLNGAIP